VNPISGWPNVRKIVDGMPVAAASIDPPLDDLEHRDEHLLALVNALHLGEVVYAREVPIEPGMAVGTLVYYDAPSATYRPAAAALNAVGDQVAPSSYAVGILWQIHTATVGTLVLYGKVKFDSPPALLDSPNAAGLRYVSYLPGRLAVEAPALRLPVGTWQPAENALLFHPASAGMTEGHTHYRFELVASPAGTVSEAYLHPHEFISANPALPGWLPAGHAVFGGLAPDGAKFGYNLARHAELLAVFPPVPLDGAVVEVYLDGAGSSRAPDDLVKITPTGIWWMRDDWGWAPWQMGADAFVAEPADPPDPGDPGRPPPVELQYGQGYTGLDNVCPARVFLWFSRPTHFTGNGVVQSLTAADNTPYVITDCAGEPASSGNLIIDFDLDATQADDDEDTGRALSRIRDNQFLLYPSVASLASKSEAIKVTGGVQNADGSFSGRLEIAYNDPSRSREVDAALFALEHARQDAFQNLFYMALPAGMASAVRGRIDLPYRDAAGARVRLELCVFATAPGTVPELSASYRRMRRPAAGSVLSAPNNSAEAALPGIVLSDGAGGAISRANVYFIAVGEAFPVDAGDTVYFTLRRNVDGYPGDIGIIRVKAVIE
jgi:hypothetical protein